MYDEGFWSVRVFKYNMDEVFWFSFVFFLAVDFFFIRSFIIGLDGLIWIMFSLFCFLILFIYIMLYLEWNFWFAEGFGKEYGFLLGRSVVWFCRLLLYFGVFSSVFSTDGLLLFNVLFLFLSFDGGYKSVFSSYFSLCFWRVFKSDLLMVFMSFWFF